MMMKMFVPIFGGLLLLAAGCSGDQAAEPAAVTEDQAVSEVTAAFAELSPEDRQAATAQKICPVSDQELGSMGKPIKVTVDGQKVFVCCAGCIDELKKNFAEYKPKLDD